MFWCVMNRDITSHTMSTRLRHVAFDLHLLTATLLYHMFLQCKNSSFVILCDSTCQSQLHALAVICQTVILVTRGSEEKYVTAMLQIEERGKAVSVKD